MDIPLIDKEDVEIEGESVEDIRKDTIEFFKNKGYEHLPANEIFEETADFFVKGRKLIEIIINDEILEEILERLRQE